MTDIIYLKYAINEYNFELMRGVRSQVIEIYPSGEIIVKNFLLGSKKIRTKSTYQSDNGLFKNLIKDIDDCIRSADSLIEYTDDTSAVLTIYYKFNRIENIPRGLGNDNARINDIITDFINRNARD